MVEKLPGYYERIAEEVKPLSQYVKYYREVGGDPDALNMLEWLIERGDTTVDLWKSPSVSTNESQRYQSYSSAVKVEGDFGIEVVDEGQADLSKSQPWQIVNVANKEPETVLFNAGTRQMLLNDIEELQSFLTQRHSEIDEQDHAIFEVYSNSRAKKSDF